MIVLGTRHDNTFGTTRHRVGDGYGTVNGGYLALIYVSEGEATVVADGTPSVVSSGECNLSITHTSYAYNNSAADRTSVCWADCRITTRDADARLQGYSNTIRATSYLAELIKLGSKLNREKGDTQVEFQASLTETVIQAYLMAARFSGMQRIAPKKMSEARQFIAENYLDEISIGDLACNLKVSTQYLVSGFKKAFGETPGRYLWRLRLEYGTLLLRRTELSVGEISYKCGFKNPYHFSRRIKEYTGHNATAYRSISSGKGRQS